MHPNRTQEHFNIFTYIKKLSRKLNSQENGSTLVWAAGMMAVLLGFAGLAIDGSNAYLERRRMQNAADAAALAGAKALAEGQAMGQVDAEIQNVATINGAENVTWNLANGSQEVNVNVTREVGTYFAHILSGDFAALDVGAVSDAGWEPVTGMQRLFPMTVECDCVDFDGQLTIEPPTEYYCVDDIIESGNGINFTVWLPELDPQSTSGGHPYSYYHVNNDQVRLDENPDGTARLKGSVVNQDNEGFKINILFEDRTSNTPPGSPKFGPYTVDASSWYYYTTSTGTIKGIAGGRYDGAVIEVVRYGPAFQIGKGAGFHEQNEFGGAMWFDWTVVTQPTTGVILKATGRGDFNLRLEDCSDLLEPGAEDSQNACQLKWVDWDGGSSTQSELASNMQDLTRSGVWHVGDWLPNGPDTFGQVSSQVEQSLNQVLNKEVPIPLHNIDQEDEYQVCGFATMELDSYDFNSAVKSVQVQFKPWVVDSETSHKNASDYGARDVRMYQSQNQ